MQPDVVKQENGRTRIVLPLGKVPEVILNQVEDAIGALENTDEVRVTRGHEWITCVRIGDGATVRYSWEAPAMHHCATLRRTRSLVSRQIVDRYGIE